ncbi:MAG: CDGSH iron-sulfur domain-containing protein [Candidatus Dadabacteria bacterium]|nr:MAG: CDGSH iron-sulfur domain-containing protein [Candidatus Dadabacteria bacterium]
MPHVETKEGKHPLTTVTLRPGEKIALCRCHVSEKFPLCDGRHQECPGQGPVVVEAAKD